jgi:hypothetical protein
MSGSNALQITDPNADSDNPLAQAPSWADAMGATGAAVSTGVDRLGQWLSEQRAKSAKMGLWNDVTGLPTGAGLVNAAQQTGNALLMGTTAPGVRAFHGSPYDFERFDPSRIGTGEGAQAYGHGLYFAEKEGTARSYRDALTVDPRDQLNRDLAQFKSLGSQNQSDTMIQSYLENNTNADLQALAKDPRAVDSIKRILAGYDPSMNSHTSDALNAYGYLDKTLPPVGSSGKMYEVNIGADPESFLHWDKPLSEQPQNVQDALAAKVDRMKQETDPIRRPMQSWLDQYEKGTLPGSSVYASLGQGSPESAAAAWQKAGIPGIRYLDQGSRGAGEGTHNYVVFDASTIDILRKYGLAGLMAGGGAAAAGSQQQPPQQ